MKSPKILIIYKRSPLLSAGTSIASTSVRFRSNHKNHYETLKHIIATIKNSGFSFHQHLRGARLDFEKYDIIISVGGDGTFLSAARSAKKNQLVFGVNSDPSWSVGQFCAADRCNFEPMLRQVIANPPFVKAYKLRLTFSASKYLECMNDILICHANPAAMSRYIIKVDKQEEFQRSSGIWIASGAGSTGAITSAGGKKLALDSREIQYMPRELYQQKEHSYSLQGGLLSQKSSIWVTSRMPHGRVYCDGAHVKYPLAFGKTVKITSSSNFIRVVVNE